MRRNRRILCLLAAGILIGGWGSHICAQELGLKLGFMRTTSDISRDLPGITVKSLHEIPFGVFLSINVIGDKLRLQPEINYSIKGFNAAEMDLGQEISSHYKISYIEIPILLQFNIPLKGRFNPAVFVGPYFGFAHKVMEIQTAFGATEKRKLGGNLKGDDIGMIFGGNLRYRIGSFHLLLDARYNLGLTNISKDIRDVSYDFSQDDTIMNRALTFSLGLSFNLN